jgi:hypothetical protein
MTHALRLNPESASGPIAVDHEQPHEPRRSKSSPRLASRVAKPVSSQAAALRSRRPTATSRAGLHRVHAGLETRRRPPPRRAHRAHRPRVRKAVKWKLPRELRPFVSIVQRPVTPLLWTNPNRTAKLPTHGCAIPGRPELPTAGMTRKSSLALVKRVVGSGSTTN